MTITLIIIAITCVVSFMAFKDERLLDRLILWPPAITRGKEWWRLASCGLIHADGPHLLFNMITLFFFGRAMEGFYVSRGGAIGYLIFYVGALVVSSLPSYLQHKNDSRYRSLGASGAVSAVLFSFILLAPWSKIIVFVLPLPAILYAVAYVAYSIYMDRQRTDNVNHSAHLWGAAYGVFATILIEPDVVGHFLRQLTQPSLGFG
ncbi:rhomboid family intramembrane serine protease [Dokdonella sp.]|uniref:rhomboid family intramembrane serine protease n=1 Tax=Dokdonella sp. TaxID=2291710 RepID=UPI001B2BCDB1|nr:rhomboid family intramembrane serine protease [Dokdonella sp.]MBO9662821.1 rhomboid family intramembrane serine protease [Dokdonella sp.]